MGDSSIIRAISLFTLNAALRCINDYNNPPRAQPYQIPQASIIALYDISIVYLTWCLKKLPLRDHLQL